MVVCAAGKIRLRQQLYWDNLSRRSATCAFVVTHRPKRCRGNHARALGRALESDEHPLDSGLPRRSLGSIRPDSASERCNAVLDTHSQDQQSSCFRSSVHDGVGRGVLCRSAEKGWAPREASTNA
jgi:hypothetical protein